MKKLKHIFIILFFVLILLSLGGAYCYFFTDMFKEPMDQFLQYAKTIEIIDLVNEEFTKEFNAKLKSSSSEITLKGELDIPNSENGNTDYNKFNINVAAKNDVFLNKAYAEVNLNYADNNLLNVTGLSDINSVAINSKEVVEQYVASGKENVGKILEKITEGSVTEKEYSEIINTLTKTEITGLTIEQREALKNNFLEIVKEYLYKEKFARENQVSTMYKEQATNVDAYSVTFTKEEVYNILLKELEALKNDSIFLNFIINNYNSTKPEQELSATSLTETINSLILSLQTQKANETDLTNTALTIVLYVLDGKAIKTDANYDSNVEVSFEIYTDGIKLTAIGNEMNFTSEENQTITADRVGFSANVTKNNPSEIAENYKYDISLIENNKVIYKIIFENVRTGIVSTNNIENIIDVTFKNMNKNEETGIKLECKTEFKDNVEISDIDPTKTVFLDKITDEEFNNVVTTLKENIFRVYSNKVKEFDVITAKSSNTIISQPGMEIEKEEQEEQSNPVQNQQNNTQEQQNNQPNNNQQQENQNTNSGDNQQPQVSTQELTKDSVKEMVVNAIIARSQEIVNNQGRNITLKDLEGLTIDGEAVSAVITNDTAILSYKGFNFTVDSSFNIS